MLELVCMKTWESLFHAWGGNGGAETIAPYTRVAGSRRCVPRYVAIVCARYIFSADPSELVEGVEGVGVGGGALCVSASSIEDILDTSSRVNPPQTRCLILR